MKSLLLALCLAGSVCFAACVRHQLSMASAYVSASTLKRAEDLAGKIDYLPTAYVKDGCYARSLYVSMELAAAGIPSSAQIVSTCHARRDAADLLHLPDGTAWNWHVAPLFVVDGEPYIIDLSFSQKPINRSDWLAHFQGGANGGLRRYFRAVPASETGNGWGDESPAVCGKDIGLDALVSNTKQMKRFREDNFLSNCQLMTAHIRKEPTLTQEEREQKVAKLIERTVFLHKSLRKNGLLKPDLSKYKYNTDADFARFKSDCLLGLPDK